MSVETDLDLIISDRDMEINWLHKDKDWMGRDELDCALNAMWCVNGSRRYYRKLKIPRKRGMGNRYRCVWHWRSPRPLWFWSWGWASHMLEVAVRAVALTWKGASVVPPTYLLSMIERFFFFPFNIKYSIFSYYFLTLFIFKNSPSASVLVPLRILTF